MVIGETSADTAFWAPFPEGDQYWAMHGRDPKFDISKVELWQGALQEEESVDVAVLLMEKDQGPPDDWMTIIQTIQNNIHPGRFTVGSTLDLEKAFTHPSKDGDDLLGAFHVRLKTQAGRLTAAWRWGARTDSQGKVAPTTEKGAPLYGHEFELQGGGGLYRAFVMTQPPYRCPLFVSPAFVRRASLPLTTLIWDSLHCKLARSLFWLFHMRLLIRTVAAQ